MSESLIQTKNFLIHSNSAGKPAKHTTSKIKLHNSNSNHNKHQSDVLFTAVYNLPKISSPISYKNKLHLSMNFTPNKSTPISYKKHNKIFSDFSKRMNTVSSVNDDKNFDNYFKDKFYEDTKATISSRPGHKLMFEDRGLKNRVIHMKQVISFWKCLCDYTGPMFTMQHFNNVKASGRNEMKEDCYFHTIGSKGSVYKRKKPVLYTNSCLQKLNRKNKIEKYKDFYLKLNKKN